MIIAGDRPCNLVVRPRVAVCREAKYISGVSFARHPQHGGSYTGAAASAAETHGAPGQHCNAMPRYPRGLCPLYAGIAVLCVNTHRELELADPAACARAAAHCRPWPLSFLVVHVVLIISCAVCRTGSSTHMCTQCTTPHHHHP